MEFAWEIIQDQRTMPVQWFLDTSEPSQRFIADHLRHKAMYEAETVAALLGALKEGDTFFDVGAHCGFFSVIASALVGPSGCVTSFEANYRNLQHFNANCGPLGNVRLVHAAVTDQPGAVEFHINEDNDGGSALWDVGKHGWNTKSREQHKTTKVQGVILDHYADQCPAAIKIDTEGAELAVLRGGFNTLSQPQLKLVIAEANTFGLEQMGHSVDDIVELMVHHGFLLDTQTGGTVGNLVFKRCTPPN